MPLVLSGDGAVGPLSATEVGYLDGVTSGVQTQLNAGGLVMVTPTTIANSGGTATLTAGAVAFSGVTSVSLNGCFTSAYENYRIVIRGATSAEADVNLRLRVAGTDNTSGIYSSAGFRAIQGANSAILNNTATSYSVTTGGYGPSPFSSSSDMYSPQLAVETTVTNVAQMYFVSEAGVSMSTLRHRTSTSFDGFTLFASTGNITGTIRVYGYRNGI